MKSDIQLLEELRDYHRSRLSKHGVEGVSGLCLSATLLFRSGSAERVRLHEVFREHIPNYKWEEYAWPLTSAGHIQRLRWLSKTIKKLKKSQS